VPALQESGCVALHTLASSDAARERIALLGGIRAAVEAMRGHARAARVQESGCVQPCARARVRATTRVIPAAQDAPS
jgi:hypothetical protein